jgi:hypothetical protein
LQGRDPNDVLSQDEQQEDDVLPEPNYDNLSVIADELSLNLDMGKKRRMSHYIMQDNVFFAL